MSFFHPHPWYKRDYETKVFTISLKHLMKHLDKHDKEKVEGYNPFNLPNRWQEEKVENVLHQMKKRKRLEAISLVLDTKKDVFRVDDGISRIIASIRLGKKKIKAEVRLASH